MYVEAFGVLKVVSGVKQLWTLASKPVGDMDDVTVHMAEVLCFQQHREKLKSELVSRWSITFLS